MQKKHPYDTINETDNDKKITIIADPEKKEFYSKMEETDMAKKVVLAGACRTAIGTMGGGLSTTPAAELGAIVIKEALNRAGVAPEKVDHVYMGCVIQAGQGQNVARQASIKAGLPNEVPAVTINVVCGSGLNCVNMAAQMIQAGDADIVVATFALQSYGSFFEPPNFFKKKFQKLFWIPPAH